MKCPRCKRNLLEAAALAPQADAVQDAVAGSLSLAQAGPEFEAAYGGAYGVRRALEAQLLKAEGLALAHARATACLAGTILGALIRL